MASPASPSSSSSHPLRPYYQPTDTQQQPLINHWLSAPTPASSSSLLPQPQLATTTRTGAPRTYLIPPEYDDMHRHGPLPDQPHRFSPLLRGYLWAGYIAWTGTAMAMPFEVGKLSSRSSGSPLPIPPPSESLPMIIWNKTMKRRSRRRIMIIWIPSQTPTTSFDWVDDIEADDVRDGECEGGGDRGTESARGGVAGVDAAGGGGARGGGDDAGGERVAGGGDSGALEGPANGPVSPLEHQSYPGLPLALAVGSSLATGLLLAPLDLVRTRLIVQSSQLRHRTYTGPVDALRTIIRTEGGLRNLFLHPALLAPALLENLLRPLLHLATPLAIDRLLGLDRAQEPVRYGLAELGFSCAALLLILPLETVRKRLQLQSRAPPSPTSRRAAVVIQTTPSLSNLDALYRIVTEEKAGVWGLFRGFNVGITANFVVFVLSVLGNQSLLTHDPTHLHDAAAGRFGSGGWAEV
ncbi:hypothetical protein PCASD_25930 [Puccinia coronata f. sp. avenae]|uniref:Uncharacterized protein n=1 Tax=Puccinia coronata f. sp. avenae TaxID=200324 RepID=A0A2N5RYW7_9BASI|nr:hypothetical protein PCASD_25930 [Puccinia coronata f. sp. avenae]